MCFSILLWLVLECSTEPQDVCKSETLTALACQGALSDDAVMV